MKNARSARVFSVGQRSRRGGNVSGTKGIYEGSDGGSGVGRLLG